MGAVWIYSAVRENLANLMAERRYDKTKPGVWEEYTSPTWIRCCDCGLVHEFHLRIRKGKIQVKVYRDNRKTAAGRRTKQFRCQPRKGKR